MDRLFANRKMNRRRLLAFGFTAEKDGYFWKSELLDGQFGLSVFISGKGEVSTHVTDSATGEEYVVFRVPNAAGTFVGRVREAHEAKLAAIAEQCFDRDVFKSAFACEVIRHIGDRYHDDPEFLWERFPQNAVFRCKDNAKWYAALLTVPRSRLGLPGGEPIEIIDLRTNPQDVERLVDGKHYFPGYHMNKKSWFTICLDGSVPIEEIFERIGISYRIAQGK